MSNVSLVTARTTSLDVMPGSRRIASRNATMCRCSTSTPFGRPVEPDVYITYARSEGATGISGDSEGCAVNGIDLAADRRRQRLEVAAGPLGVAADERANSWGNLTGVVGFDGLSNQPGVGAPLDEPLADPAQHQRFDAFRCLDRNPGGDAGAHRIAQDGRAADAKKIKKAKDIRGQER